MVFWTGKGDMHLTYLPRKPTELGFKIDTMCCAESNICLAAEVDEGKEIMAKAEYRDKVGAGTATTLRLVKKYKDSKRTVIGDSRFGSCNTVEWLWDEMSLHSIMAVKTAHAGYPKTKMREALGSTRGTHKCFKVEVKMDNKEDLEYYASGLLDKKAMYVVATCGTSLITRVAQRRTRNPKSQAPPTYELPMPEMHALYRRYFNAVDLFNRDCFGPKSVQMSIKTHSWYRRFFLAILGMCETNAMNAYRMEKGHIERFTWLSKLAEVLIYNPEVVDSDAGIEETGGDVSEHCNLHYHNHAFRCWACGRLTHWRCGCGAGLCAAGTSDKLQRGPCYYNHIRSTILEELGAVDGTQGT